MPCWVSWRYVSCFQNSRRLPSYPLTESDCMKRLSTGSAKPITNPTKRANGSFGYSNQVEWMENSETCLDVLDSDLSKKWESSERRNPNGTWIGKHQLYCWDNHIWLEYQIWVSVNENWTQVWLNFEARSRDGWMKREIGLLQRSKWVVNNNLWDKTLT